MFIVRRSTSRPGSYAITVQQGGNRIKSYEVHDLGFGQVSVSGAGGGMAFASLEHLLEFFFDNPFPDPTHGHVMLTSM